MNNISIMLAKNNEIWNTFFTVGAFFAIYITIEIMKYFLKRVTSSKNATHKMDDHFNRELKREMANNTLYDILETARLDMDGDRMQVFEFSNGTHAVSFLPFKYMDVTYEVHSVKLSPIADTHKRILTSLFGTFYSRLSSSAVVDLNLYEKDLTIPSSVYHNMDKRAAIRSLSAAIRHPNTRRVIGFVNIDRSTEEKFSTEQGKKLETLAATIATYLTYYPEEIGRKNKLWRKY